MKKPLILDGNSPKPEAPKIEFPCKNYPIKVIGHNAEDLISAVLQIMAEYDTEIDTKKVTHQDSRNGKFRSVRMSITAQSEKHLADMYAALKASGRVVTVI